MKSLAIVACVLALAFGSKTHASNCPAPKAPANVAVSGHPFGIAATSDNCWMYVALSNEGGHGAVAVLHNQDGTFSVEHTVALDSQGFGESLTHDGQTLLVASGKNTLALSTAALQRGDSNAVLGKFHSGDDAGAVYAAISPDDKLLFVSDEGSARISVFDLAKAQSGGFHDAEPIGRIPVAYFPVGLAFSPDGRWLYATSERAGIGSSMENTCASEQQRGRMHPQGLLFRIDVQKVSTDAEHAVVAAIPAGCNPVRVVVSPSGKQLWVTARGDNALLRFQVDEWLAQSHQATFRRFPIGTSPVGVAIRPDGKQVWVALSDRFDKGSAGQLAGLADATDDAPSKRMTASAAGFPRELIFLPDGQTLVATLFNANQVLVLPTTND
jgi:DNA-binding beta-propeller fold protein YncE